MLMLHLLIGSLGPAVEVNPLSMRQDNYYQLTNVNNTH